MMIQRTEVLEMQIESLKIENYRGLTIDIKTIEEVALIIGQNDSGKTNVCSAILKLLDYNHRRIPFVASDSTGCNLKPIIITAKLGLTNLSNEQSALVREYIHEKDNKKYIVVSIVSNFNNDTLIYEDTMYLGDPDQDFIEVRAEHQCAIDKILSIIYINPSYDNKQDKKDFFKHKESNYIGSVEEGNRFSEKIENTIEILNQNIQDEKAFKQIIDDINNFGSFDNIFEDIDMKLTPNIKLNNIFNSLDITYQGKDGKEINNIGDGKSKILSMLLKSKTFDSEKQKIYIVEEPENHLYVLLQRLYVESLLEMKPSQLIITTHSPYTIDFERTKQIIKIAYNHESTERTVYLFNVNNNDFKELGYLINSEIAEMLYYNSVLLVEGESEKYFYNLLMIKDNDFMKKIIDTKIGIFSVNGIAFKTVRKLLHKLGVKVMIKTDNDIFKVQKTKNQYRYAGLKRCIDYLDDCEKKNINDILGFEDVSNSENYKFMGKETLNPSIEAKMKDICNKLREYNIYLQEHHDGFEKDFLDYIGLSENEYDEAFKNLKKAKLINLHEFITENDIDISLNKENRNSILVSFYGN